MDYLLALLDRMLVSFVLGIALGQGFFSMLRVRFLDHQVLSLLSSNLPSTLPDDLETHILGWPCQGLLAKVRKLGMHLVHSLF